MSESNQRMVQYGVWPNCCNACKFCLRLERIPYDKQTQLFWLDAIKRNIDSVDWKNKFSYGISLLGGELYYITDKDLQISFLELIDIIIEKILKVSANPECKYSTVTNGLYQADFLYEVCDKIVNSVGVDKLDINFSYDFKYRFKNENDSQLVLKNINDFHNRYNYTVSTQMILTQYVIDMWKNHKTLVSDFINDKIPGNHLSFLYPHPIHSGFEMNDFNFKRSDLLQFLAYLKHDCYATYASFMHSTKNSCIFKYTGLMGRIKSEVDYNQQPVLTDGKEILTECGHSQLYRCYSDCNKCVLCDLKNFDKEIYL